MDQMKMLEALKVAVKDANEKIKVLQEWICAI